MQLRNPFDVLGVPENASSTEIHTAYIQRAKVLHPDRFDQASQPIEWQMANDMLQELNEAYAEVNSGGQQVPKQPVIPNTYPAPGSEHDQEEISVAKTSQYWAEMSEISQSAGLALNLIPALEVKTRRIIGGVCQQNYDQHLKGLREYIDVNFKAQLALPKLDQTAVDPIALRGGAEVLEGLNQLSQLLVERIRLVERAQQLFIKYPFWKVMWSGYDSLGISVNEFKADDIEWRAMNSNAAALEQRFFQALQTQISIIDAIRMQLKNKYP